MTWEETYFVVKNGMILNIFGDFDSAKQCCINAHATVWNCGKLIYAMD